MSHANMEFTQAFMDRMSDPEFVKEAQEKGRAMIRDHIRESSFTDKLFKASPAKMSDPDIIPPREGNLPVWRAEIEPGSRALVVNIPSRADARVISAKRVDFPFVTLETEWYQGSEDEFLVYQGDLIGQIKKNTDDDIGDPLDLLALTYLESSCRFMQSESNTTPQAYNITNITGGDVANAIVKGDNALASAGDDFVLYPPTTNDFIKLANLRGSNKRIRITRMLITENDHRKLSALQAEDMGLKNKDKMAYDGWTANRFVGFDFIITIKGDILREGNIYGLAEEDFVGRSLTLRDIQFWAEKRARQFSMTAWTTKCIGVVNVATIVKLELYGGSSWIDYPDTGYEAVVPVAEEDLGEQQNRVGADGYFPNTDTI